PPMRRRIKDMARFMKQGELEPYSNICFGAGGAGTYSDGKLITRIRSPYIGYIMAQFVKYGAPESIRYLYNPHLGSNKIRHCITAMLGAMEDEGVDIRYNTRLIDFEIGGDGSISRIETSQGTLAEPLALFLATGHSAREVYAMLRSRGIPMEAKEFAMGVRVEHRAEFINQVQYGPHYRERYEGIETAQYKLAKTWKDENRAVYSFCMCPGGYVLNASTDTSGVVTNGMSNYLKSGKYSNAAVVVNTSQDDLNRAGYSGVDGGLAMQRELEERFRASVNEAGKCNTVPAQRLTDFLGGSASKSLGGGSCLNPFAPAAMHELFPVFMLKALRRGFEQFDRKMRGFAGDPEALVYGIESRTSAPYRILRDPERLTSPVCPQLYPAGEGAGFAGGITSAAVDGIRCAEAWLETLR
ncbi:MAG: hypothetical protein CL946_07170, partial [Ectothiorhodospiraceae bacterium]|nr:hypothetical protein [Ectothiorhodospiraceae bacterium]